MAKKILLFLAFAEAVLLASGGIMYFRLKRDLFRMEERSRDAESRASLESDRAALLSKENNFTTDRLLALQAELNQARSRKPRVVQPPVTPVTQAAAQPSPQPVRSAEQAAADQRAQWARLHAAQIAHAKGTDKPTPQRVETDPEDSAETAAKQDAENLAKRNASDYFRHHWSPGGALIAVTKVEITISSTEAKTGWNGEWDVAGEAYIEYFVSGAETYSSNLRHFTADVKPETKECSINDSF